MILLAVIISVTVGHVSCYYVVDSSNYDSYQDVYEKAAVSSFGAECAPIGASMLKRNGSAVDAAVATLLCEGIASLHSMGLGGGFLMTIYDATTDTVDFLNARETAPEAAYRDMYDGNASLSDSGGLAVAVPGELMGYWEAHQKYGRLPWKDLFEPSIELCHTGSLINSHVAGKLKGVEDYIRAEPTLAEILINPVTNELYGAGDRLKRPQLAKTLRKLADSDDPIALFYRGDIAEQLAQEIQGFDGIITAEDFADYRVNWTKPIESKIGNMTLYSSPPPGSGALLAFMMNVLEGFIPINDKNIMWQRITETFKWAYARRTELGDPHFVPIDDLLKNLTSKEFARITRSSIYDDKTFDDPKHYGAVFTNEEDHGTAHISVLAPDGSAVSVTTTINQILGAKIRSESTGIIFNNEMDDFSSPNITNGFDLPPSPNNYIKPHKRPMSSMVPTIVLDENRQVRLVVGAAGGTTITTAVTLVTIHNLWNNFNIKEAVNAPRLHHQLFPMRIQNEENFPADILHYLRKIGHDSSILSGLGSAVTAIARENNRITANADYRRQGATAGF